MSKIVNLEEFEECKKKSVSYQPLSLEEGKKWWLSLDVIGRELVFGELCHKQLTLEEMLKISGVDSYSDGFCYSPFFPLALDIVNQIRREQRR